MEKDKAFLIALVVIALIVGYYYITKEKDTWTDGETKINGLGATYY